MAENNVPRPKQTHQGRKTGRTANTLQGAQRFALWQELVKAQGELEAERATYPRAAEMMAQRLGFAVTKANVADAVEQGIVSWRGPGRGGDFGRRTSQRVIDLEARVTALEDMVLRLCEASGTSKVVEPMKAPDAWVSK